MDPNKNQIKSCNYAIKKNIIRQKVSLTGECASDSWYEHFEGEAVN